MVYELDIQILIVLPTLYKKHCKYFPMKQWVDVLCDSWDNFGNANILETLI